MTDFPPFEPSPAPPSGDQSGRLFDEFPPVPTKAWEERIRLDLRERGYASTLLWRPAHDLVFRPYYRSEDLETLPHVASSSGGILPAIQPGWCIRQDVPLLDPETTRRLMSDAVEGGVERLGLKLDPATPPVMTTGPETGWIGTLLDGLDLEAVSLHLEAGLESIDWLDAVLACDGPAGASPEGSTAAYDPLSTLARTGQYAPRWMDRVGHALDALLSTPHRFLCVGAEAYHEAGANIVEETALLLATLSEYLVQLGDRGSSPAQTLSHCYLSVPVEASHLLSIARLRALRILIPQLLQGFSVAGGVLRTTKPAPVIRRLRAMGHRRMMSRLPTAGHPSPSMLASRDET